MIPAASDRTPAELPRLRLLVAVTACLARWLVPGVAVAADKTSLACIRAAEDGQAARDGGQLLRARELFAVCAARECPTVLRRDCTGWLEDARRQTPSLVVIARDTAGRDVVDAQVTVDGVLRQPHLDGSAIELDPGVHVVRVQTAGIESDEERVVLAAGERNRTLNVTFARPQPQPAAPPVLSPASPSPPPSQPESIPEPHGSGVPAATYLFGGLGVAALGVFGYFGISGLSDANHLRATCVPACQSSDVDAVHTKLVAADIALGVAVASLAVATWFGVRALSNPRRASWEVRIAPRVGGAAGAVLVRF